MGPKLWTSFGFRAISRGCVCDAGGESNGEDQREKILSYYNLTEESYEYRDLVCQDGTGDWVAELFVMSTDYNLVLLYRRDYE